MNIAHYQAQASRTMNRIAITDEFANHALGLAGECGEVVELIKKHLYHGKTLDHDRLAEELGDLLWYVAAVATTAGLNLDAIATDNISKLQARYPDGFKNAHPIADRWKLNTIKRSE